MNVDKEIKVTLRTIEESNLREISELHSVELLKQNELQTALL